MLSINSDDWVAFYLGHKHSDWRYLLTITTFSSIYMLFVHYNLHNGHAMLSWQPFQAICGLRPPIEFGLNDEMFEKLITKSRLVFAKSQLNAFLRTASGLYVLLNLYDYDTFTGLIWIWILCVFIYLQSGALYMMSACFRVLCHYFELRFEKVHMDTNECLTKSLQPLLVNILKEHNHLCSRLHEYNRFWCRYVLLAYFVLPSVWLYGLYQAVYTNQMGLVIVM